MMGIHAHARDLAFVGERSSMRLTTLVGAAAALALTVFVLGSPLFGGAVPASDSTTPVSVLGP